MSELNQNPENMAIVKSRPAEEDQIKDSPGLRMREKNLKRPKRWEAEVERARERTRKFEPQARKTLSHREQSETHPILKNVKKLIGS